MMINIADVSCNTDTTTNVESNTQFIIVLLSLIAPSVLGVFEEFGSVSILIQFP